VPAVLQAASAIAAGMATRVLIIGGAAGVYTERASTAPWTRPTNEFVVAYGMFTAAEFALIARRHMHMYGSTPEQFATIAATIRNNGHVHPDAIYHGRGPYTPEDILSSRMVADPYHLLDCAMTSEGGSAIVLARADRVADLPHKPVYVLGGTSDRIGPSYRHAPAWDIRGRDDDGIPNGLVGRRAARRAFATAGLRPDDVDVCEFYDPFSFEIIRQFEAFEFCAEGEGGDFVMDGNIGPGGRFPVTTDGGLMSFSHGGATVQLLQRAIRGVEQLRGTCVTMQVEGAEVAMCTGGGAGALFNDVMLIGSERP
jgi:acetyl-CoA acetyltransferase